ncbi:MAG: hypothetical protein KBC91_01290 [Candidatus Omnitrophica bacterium]|nr:hypothetical protein [Candidatus Omnitrophota bacterium]
MRPGETVVDLGHGNGEVLFTAAALYGAKGIGAEWNDLHYRRSVAGRDTLIHEGLFAESQVELQHADFNALDLSQADYVFYHSSGAAAESISFEKIISQMKPGAKLLLMGVQVDEDEETSDGGTRTNYYQDFSRLLESGQFELKRHPRPGVWIFTKHLEPVIRYRHSLVTSVTTAAPIREKFSAEGDAERLIAAYSARIEADELLNRHFNKAHLAQLRMYAPQAQKSVLKLDDGKALDVLVVKAGRPTRYDSNHLYYALYFLKGAPVAYAIADMGDNDDLTTVTAQVGFHLFKEYREGAVSGQTLSSAEIFRNALQLFYDEEPGIQKFTLDANQQISSWMGDEGTSLLFYLNAGFYPPREKELADKVLEMKLSGQRFDLSPGSADFKTYLAPLLETRKNEMWGFPVVARSEVRGNADALPLASDLRTRRSEVRSSVDQVKAAPELPKAASGELRYFIAYKPRSVLSSEREAQGDSRRTIYDLLRESAGVSADEYSVAGRLDFDVDGLVLLTNDPDFFAVLSPAAHVSKTYKVSFNDLFTDEQAEQLRRGVVIETHDYQQKPVRYMTQQAGVRILSRRHDYSEVELTIREGKWHQVKKMFEAVGVPRIRLTRTAFADFNLKQLPLKYGQVFELKGAHRASALAIRDSALEILAAQNRSQPDLAINTALAKMTEDDQHAAMQQFNARQIMRLMNDSRNRALLAMDWFQQYKGRDAADRFFSKTALWTAHHYPDFAMDMINAARISYRADEEMTRKIVSLSEAYSKGRLGTTVVLQLLRMMRKPDFDPSRPVQPVGLAQKTRSISLIAAEILAGLSHAVSMADVYQIAVKLQELEKIDFVSALRQIEKFPGPPHDGVSTEEQILEHAKKFLELYHAEFSAEGTPEGQILQPESAEPAVRQALLGRFPADRIEQGIGYVRSIFRNEGEVPVVDLSALPTVQEFMERTGIRFKFFGAQEYLSTRPSKSEQEPTVTGSFKRRQFAEKIIKSGFLYRVGVEQPGIPPVFYINSSGNAIQGLLHEVQLFVEDGIEMDGALYKLPEGSKVIMVAHDTLSPAKEKMVREKFPKYSGGVFFLSKFIEEARKLGMYAGEDDAAVKHKLENINTLLSEMDGFVDLWNAVNPNDPRMHVRASNEESALVGGASILRNVREKLAAQGIDHVDYIAMGRGGGGPTAGMALEAKYHLDQTGQKTEVWAVGSDIPTVSLADGQAIQNAQSLFQETLQGVPEHLKSANIPEEFFYKAVADIHAYAAATGKPLKIEASAASGLAKLYSIMADPSQWHLLKPDAGNREKVYVTVLSGMNYGQYVVDEANRIFNRDQMQGADYLFAQAVYQNLKARVDYALTLERLQGGFIRTRHGSSYPPDGGAGIRRDTSEALTAESLPLAADSLTLASIDYEVRSLNKQLQSAVDAAAIRPVVLAHLREDAVFESKLKQWRSEVRGFSFSSLMKLRKTLGPDERRALVWNAAIFGFYAVALLAVFAARDWLNQKGLPQPMIVNSAPSFIMVGISIAYSAIRKFLFGQQKDLFQPSQQRSEVLFWTGVFAGLEAGVPMLPNFVKQIVRSGTTFEWTDLAAIGLAGIVHYGLSRVIYQKPLSDQPARSEVRIAAVEDQVRQKLREQGYRVTSDLMLGGSNSVFFRAQDSSGQDVMIKVSDWDQDRNDRVDTQQEYIDGNNESVGGKNESLIGHSFPFLVGYHAQGNIAVNLEVDDELKDQNLNYEVLEYLDEDWQRLKVGRIRKGLDVSDVFSTEADALGFLKAAYEAMNQIEADGIQKVNTPAIYWDFSFKNVLFNQKTKDFKFVDLDISLGDPFYYRERSVLFAEDAAALLETLDSSSPAAKLFLDYKAGDNNDLSDQKKKWTELGDLLIQAERRSEVRVTSSDQLDPKFKRWIASARLLIRNSGIYIMQLPEKSSLYTPERLKAGRLLVELNQVLGRMKIVPVNADGRAGLAMDLKNPTIFIHGPEARDQHSIESVARTLIRAALTFREFKKHPEWKDLPVAEKKIKNAEFALQADMALSQVKKNVYGRDTDFGLLNDLVEEQVLAWLDPENKFFAAVQARKGVLDAQAQAEYEADVRSGKIQPVLPQAMKVYFALLQMDFSEHRDLEKLGQSTSGFELELTEALNTQVLPDQKDPLPELLAGLINAMSALIRKEKVPASETMQVLMDEQWVKLLARQVTEALRVYILSQYWQGDDLFALQNRLGRALTQIDPELQLYSSIRHGFLLESIQQALAAADISVDAAEKLQTELQAGRHGNTSALGNAMASALRLTSDAAASQSVLRIGGGQTLRIAGPDSVPSAGNTESAQAAGAVESGDAAVVKTEPKRVLDLTKRPPLPDDAGYNLSGQILVINMEKLLKRLAGSTEPVTVEYFVENYPADWMANLDTAFRRREGGQIMTLEEFKDVLLFMLHLYHLETQQGKMMKKNVKALEEGWAQAGNKIGDIFSDAELDRLVKQLGTQERVGKKKGGVFNKEQIRTASFIALGLIAHLMRLKKRDEADNRMGDQELAPKARQFYGKALGELGQETGDPFFGYVVANLTVVEQVMQKQKRTAPTAEVKTAAPSSMPLAMDDAASVVPESGAPAKPRRNLWSVMTGAVGKGEKTDAAPAPEAKPAQPEYSTEPSFEGFLARVEKIGNTVRRYVERKNIKEAVNAIKILFGGTGSEEDFKKGYKDIQKNTHSDRFQGREEINKASSEIEGIIGGDNINQKDLLAALDKLLESARVFLKTLNDTDRERISAKSPAPKTDSVPVAQSGLSGQADAILKQILAEVQRGNALTEHGNNLLAQLITALGHTPVAGPVVAAAETVIANQQADKKTESADATSVSSGLKQQMEALLSRVLALRRSLEPLQAKHLKFQENNAVYDVAVGMTITGSNREEEFKSLVTQIPQWLEQLSPAAYENLAGSDLPVNDLQTQYDLFNKSLTDAELAIPIFRQLIDGLESAWPMATTMAAQIASAKSEVRYGKSPNPGVPAREVLPVIQQMIADKKSLLSGPRPVLIAVDGDKGAGKTYFSKYLLGVLDARVIHVDDFVDQDAEDRYAKDWSKLAGEISRVSAEQPAVIFVEGYHVLDAKLPADLSFRIQTDEETRRQNIIDRFNLQKRTFSDSDVGQALLVQSRYIQEPTYDLIIDNSREQREHLVAGAPGKIIAAEKRSEVRQIGDERRATASVVSVARWMTAKIVRVSDLRPEILEKLFPLVLQQPEAKLPEAERQWISRFYTALFKQGRSIILPAALLRQVSTEAQRDYITLLIEALQTAKANPREPLINIADDQNNELKNLFFSPENWRAQPSAGVDVSRAVKFWRETEGFVAARLEKQKTRFAAAVTKPATLRSRAFLVKPEDVRKLTRIQRVIFQARLTQLLQAASALNEEEFAQLSRELGLNYQVGQAIALAPSAILSSIFAERMNAVALSVSA